MKRKVVITGLGCVTPVGNNVKDFWKSLCEGRSGITRIDRFDTTEFVSQIAGQIKGEIIPHGMSKKDLRRNDLFSIYGYEATDQAWAQSGIDLNITDPARCGVIMGSGIGGLCTIEEQVIVMHHKGPRRVTPMMIPKSLLNMGAGNIGLRLGLQGPNKAIVTACASATHSIGDAAELISGNKADVMVAGGTEAPICAFAVGGFGILQALSTRNDEPERASRAFDKDRDGFVISEGAGAVVLEAEEHAKARGAEILCEMAGYGETCDAHHMTAPREDALCITRAMKIALDGAELNPQDIGYFNAHGTSTKYNDRSEANALRIVFGDGDDMPYVSSTKSVTGHLLGAAGAVEAIASILAINEGILPPSINYETPDPECDVNIIANEAMEKNVDAVMSNSLGFGGHNASIVLRKYDGKASTD